MRDVTRCAIGDHEAIATLSKEETNMDIEKKFTMRDKDGLTPLHVAARYGNMKEIKALIEAEANIKAEYGDGYTPLHEAASNGTAETVKALIDAGANIKAQDGSGWTPLHWAAHDGTAETVEALIDRGAEMRARTKDGKLPAGLAEDNEAVHNHPVFQKLNAQRYE
ncbi:MAG: ankyrin repeat domain-containing protein [Rhodospirillales bacterium]|nr:ankyrin repeat domain-containing protein [Rhodospirillales bacterium]